METIKQGSKGNDVKKLQEFLHLTADGIFGKQTHEALVKYQKNNGLTADGICGAKTWEKILGTTENSKCVDESVIYKPINVHITKSPNRTIKYLSLHFTAGSSSAKGKAEANRGVFLQRSASADFIVDDDTILQVNPDLKNYYCWAVGDKTTKAEGGATLSGKAVNKNTISIEICSTCEKGTNVGYANHNGWSFTDKALKNAEKLCKILMKKYGIKIDNVVRHYDITGKLCPGIVGWNCGHIYDSKTGKITKEKNNEKKFLEFKEKLTK